MKKILLLTFSLIFVSLTSADYEYGIPDIKLITASSFYNDGLLATKNKQAIVVMFGAEYCSFCEALETEILRPMQISQANSNYLIRRVEVNLDTKITDFDGEQISMSKFSDKHNIYVTPTLVFFDNNGVESGQRIIGVNGIDLIGYYIDANITLASQKNTSHDR